MLKGYNHNERKMDFFDRSGSSITPSGVEGLPFAKDYEKVVTRLFVAEDGVADAVSLSWLDGGSEG